MSDKHFNIRVTGKVQGVFFRASVMDKALDLGLRGFVRNEPDGSVYIEAEGPEKQLNLLAEWCKTGSQFSKVEDVLLKISSVNSFRAFEIQR